MAFPYNEQQGIDFQKDVQAAYAKAGQALDLMNVVWSNRMTYDAVEMDYPASRAKHLTELYIALGLVPPFNPAPRFWRGNMCGVRIPGAPSVSGGANDSSLILSWFYDRYPKGWRDIIRANWKSKDLTHVLTSWPDSRAAGLNEDDFIQIQMELMGDGFFPCPFLSSKDFDPHDPVEIMKGLEVLIPKLVRIGIPMVCIGWELSLFLKPVEVQMLIDAIAPIFTPIKTKVYVHFQEGYMGFQKDGGTLADFWTPNVGKLTGVLYQKILSQNKDQFLDSLSDCLQRLSGGFNMPDDSGFGHPFDLVGLELTAMDQFNGNMSEAQGNQVGQWAINAPHVFGPAGEVMVMGSGNGL